MEQQDVRFCAASRRLWAVPIVIVATAVLSACSSAGVADSRYKGAPPGIEYSLGSSAPVVFASGDGSVDVVTWGSSSCPATATEFTVDDHSFSVTFEQSTKSVCTADIGPTTHVFGAERLGGVIPQTAHITFADPREEYTVDVVHG